MINVVKLLLRWTVFSLDLGNCIIPALPFTSKFLPKEPKEPRETSSIASKGLWLWKLSTGQQLPAPPPRHSTSRSLQTLLAQATLIDFSPAETCRQKQMFISMYTYRPQILQIDFLLSLGSAHAPLK